MDFDVAFASPDATLAAGVSDILEKSGIPVASPLKNAARIEWDKNYMRTLMKSHKLRGAVGYELVHSIDEAKKALSRLGEVAIKPLGLTGGKGVKISGEHFNDEKGALEYVNEVLAKDKAVLMEEKITGEEFSLQAFCDGTRISAMPPVQDHKRAYEGDSGPNTGGMGSYSTGAVLPFIDKKDVEDGERILQDIVHAMKKDGTPFKGVMYGQFMACKDGIRVIEINSRFGDPEAMNVLALLETPLEDMLLSIADGSLQRARFKNACTVVKYLVPTGYPDKPVADSEAKVDSKCIEDAGAKIYYASVYEKEGKIFTSNSRAFGMLGVAPSVEEAERIAEKACGCVSGELWHRRDIGTQQLINKKVARMKEIREK
jgi:phosphoribosylamine--glycine ligase